MKKRLIYAFIGVVLAAIAIVKLANAQEGHYTYLPIVNRDWPPPCQPDPYRMENHDISQNPPGFDYWNVTSLSGTENVVIVWFKMAGYDSTQYKLRVRPEDGELYLLGGGLIKYWGPGCVNEADVAFQAENLQEITLEWLEEHNLLIDPTTCTNEPVEVVRDPVKDIPWLLGGPRQIVVLRPGWSNQTPDDQGESKTLLFPEGDWQWPILMGGRSYTFPAGCGKQAEAFFNASDLPTCNLQCLADRGLMAWPAP